ncbi:hypothetical protein JRO89_XS15G0182900 [Xanthoceras sorbifolium]|uniref:Disease resistance RPP13-like protein 1 n=1 Tax=Xanthoceras sorbifolium TaxID=99658 RepID=A0ABQ8H2W0_9ROSI|nr:hypothetical protein JRO89_XS15G0182900 [Xanthoceras sorbifolium]
MAELILSAVLPVLFEKLASSELLNFATQEGVRSKLKKWEKTLKTIKSLLVDAEQKQQDDEAVKMWLDDLRDLAYDAEDILDEYATEALRRKLKIEEYQASTSRARKLIPACCVGCTPSALWSDFNMRSKIDDVTRRFEELRLQTDVLRLKEIARPASTTSSHRAPTSSLQTELAVYGRDQDKANILEMVLSDEPGDVNFGVISIVGMGGVGKTTMAREVYNDEAVKEFNPKGWACVSDDFDVMRISKAILESITGCSRDLENLDAVQKELKKEVAGSKFLLVLDDVWSTNYSKWETLRSPFLAGAQGSKIIVTTRLDGVASTMGSFKKLYRLQLLTDNECWSLFTKHAFDNGVMDGHPSDSIRQKVVEKCNGLPLATKTLGGLLRSKSYDEWLNILNSNICDLEGGEEIPEALKLSYYHLPPHLKRCYAYCAIFPKDYEFEEHELVLLWMAEGLIQQSDVNKQLEDMGGEYFRDLLSRSIFLTSSSNASKFVMHDLVNDLAGIVSGKISFRWDIKQESNKQSKISTKTRYSSYICQEYNVKKNFEVFNNANHLRTHLSVGLVDYKYKGCYISHSVVSDLLLKFEKLRVLSLQGYRITEIPNSVGGVRLLRYLNLSYSKIRSLPESVNSMCNLQTLLLRYCYALLKLPYNMGNLIKLRHLDILGASSIEEMPLGVRKWECLRTLSNFIVGKDSGSNLKDLEDLEFLCGELHISKLENVTNFQDTKKVILSNKKDLKVLLLEWGSRFEESRDEEVDKKVLDMLQPHQNLEKLTIKHYGGTRFSTWVGDSSFSEITVLKLKGCKKCTSLPSLGLLSSLKSLTIKGMEGIKSIGFEFYGDGWSKPFPSLETLCFEDLEGWECWNPVKENESFPELQELSIVNCPRLSERLPNNLSSLKKLVIRKCAQLVVLLSNIPRLCEVKLDECKKIVSSGSAYSESLESMSLSNISDFSDWSRQEFKKVQSLKIEGCEELIELWQKEIFVNKPPQEFHSLISLRELDFEHCNTLTTLLEGIKQKHTHVEELNIARCDSLNFIFRGQLPQSLKKFRIKNCKKLQCLVDGNEEIRTSLSSAIINFLKKFRFPTFLIPKENVNTSTSHLEYLDIEGCPSLSCLPSIDQLSASLTSLRIASCSKLTTLSLTGHLPVALKCLYIESCSELTTILPKGQLPETLETLTIWYCPMLKSIVEKFHNNKALKEINIMSCDNLEFLPEGLHTLSNLNFLLIWFCPGFTSFPEGGFPNNNLRVLIEECEKLKALPSGIHTLTSFQELSIRDCGNMSLSEEGLPTKLAKLSIHGLKQYKPLMEWGLRNLTSLTYLDISVRPDGDCFQEEDMRVTLPRTLTELLIGGFPKLKSLPFKDFEDLRSLESLSIYNCPELRSLPNLPSSLESLDIINCPELRSLPNLPSSLESLDIINCPELTSLPNLPSSLESLQIDNCPELRSLPNLPSSLESLQIDNCPELRSLPSLPSSLLQLYIRNCPLLKEACKRDKGSEWSKIADIPCVEIDRKFIYDPEEASDH